MMNLGILVYGTNTPMLIAFLVAYSTQLLPQQLAQADFAGRGTCKTA
jgi:hypothetical protein